MSKPIVIEYASPEHKELVAPPRRRIYLASSWRNPFQPQAVDMLRAAGHEVYDFRNPAPGNQGFAWSEIDENWQSWPPNLFIAGLQHPLAQRGYRLNKDALDWCDSCVLLLPCGRSAHLELGYAIGRGKQSLAVLAAGAEPELMYLLADKVVSDLSLLLPALEGLA